MKMDYLDTLAGQVEWAATNMAYNLDYIPADKMDWKPAPTANSALEIINHNVTALKSLQTVLSEGSTNTPEFTPATNVAEAKQLIVSAAQEYAQALRAMNLADMNKTVQMRFGPFPLGRVVSMGVIDTIHHHGQIAYIQTLLGDSDSHFDPASFES
ncbi:MAG: DinB family protein [Abitibacteriaceae bacterium]|nr:DinB family protein [Abditibacteriaceae bacterium]MBV9867275.1 DinB family protein [Abditibacteriaceae bacterium]